MRGACRFIFAVSLSLLLGCATEPTKVYSTQDVDLKYLQSMLSEPVQITEQTVILDSRPAFDFALIHHPQAVNVLWTDFTDTRGPYPGLLLKDLDQAVRRLALLGISPSTPVVVVGLGDKGNGEEGRLAWTLFYLGLSRVQVIDLEKLGARYTNITPPPRENAKVWEPEYRTKVLADKKEVMRLATSKHDERTHIIDVRSKNEYFSKNRKLEYEYPDLRAINIEWKEFFSSQGRPNMAIRDQLKAIGVNLTDRIVVISNNGVRSGAVTFALLSLGYVNASNYAGGYSELLGLPKQ